jgi:enoyl-CoA hydratase/carnithine racemase
MTVQAEKCANQTNSSKFGTSVLSTQDDCIRVISLNRPYRLNAIDRSLLEDLNEALKDAFSDPTVKVLILRGEGRAFCAGDDLVEQLKGGTLTPEELNTFVNLLQQVTVQLMMGSKPVVGLVQGWAIGGGFSWTLNCDLTIWSETARAYLPEVGFGMFVSGAASFLLPRMMGRMSTFEMTLLSPKLSSQQLKELGIAWRVVPDEALFAEGMTVARKLAELPEGAAKQFKKSLLEPDRQLVLNALDNESKACISGAADPRTLARIQSFLTARA